MRTAVEVAVEAGVPVSFDINHRATLWGTRDPREQYLAVAQRADVIFAGDDEAALLVGPGEPGELATRLAGLGPSQAIVKLGALGLRRQHRRGHARGPGGAGEVWWTRSEQATRSSPATCPRSWSRRRRTPASCRRSGAARSRASGAGDWESLPRTADLERIGSQDPVAR